MKNIIVRLTHNKNIENKIALVITFIGLLVLISGTSYAILKGTASSTNEQVIKAGSVTLKLTEKFENIDKKIMIMEDSEGLLQETTYDFNIKNIGDTTARYDVKLVNEIPSNYTGEVLSIEYIKVGLEINEEEYGPMSLEELNGIIDSGIIYKKEVINYKLRIWLDSDKQNELEELSDYKAFLKLKVEVEQRPDDFDTKITTFNYTGKTEKYVVPRDGWYYIELAGASGTNSYNTYVSTYPTYGAITSGYVELKAGEKLSFNVGGSGKTFNCCSKQGGRTGSGGATDVRIYEDDISTTNFRYVRDYLNGSDANSSSHWVEIKVYDESGQLISQGKEVAYEGTGPHYNTTIESTSILTDGDIATANYFGLKGNNQYVEVDLGQEYKISKVEIWHYYGDGRTYYNNKTMLLNDDKTKSITIFDSDKSGTYAETSTGRTSQNTNLNKDLISRIMVAGGAGVTYADSSGCYGPSATGLYSEAIKTCSYYNMNSATQINGGKAELNGTAGSFGYGGVNTTPAYSSGGGGYYGGGSGPSGGAGSSYISGYAGVNSVANNTTTITHTKETLHYSGKYFVGGKIIPSSNEGDGYAKIVYVDEKPKRKNTILNNVRYVRSCVKLNTYNNGSHWIEMQAIKDGVNIAKGRTIIGTSAELSTAPYSVITDGDITYSNYARPADQSAATIDCVTIDLGENQDLDEVAVWNYFGDERRYLNDRMYVSSDNTNWTQLSDETQVQNSNGYRINAYNDTINGYVRSDIKQWLDGYANTGADRSTTTTVWEDLSGSGYEGTLTGGTWYHNYLYFNGTSNYVTTTSTSTTLPKTYSLVFSTDSTASQIIFGDYKTKAALGLFNNNNQFIMVLGTGNNSNIFNTGGIETGKFYKIDVIFNGLSDIKVYKNGKLLEKTSSMNNWLWDDTNSYLGRRAQGTYFKGKIGIYIMYDKALTNEEIIHNYLYDKQRYHLD